jgi:hypothetical protein
MSECAVVMLVDSHSGGFSSLEKTVFCKLPVACAAFYDPQFIGVQLNV